MPETPCGSNEAPHPEQLALIGGAEQAAGGPPARAVGTELGGSGRPRRYKEGLNAAQPMLLPASVEDYVSADNPVRAIKAYVESLDLSALGFKHAAGVLKAGQPAFAPGDLLGLYLYGYLNRVRSSRRLEAECRRNLEVIWLLGGLTPGYHTIADFRKDNAKALKAANCDFVLLCRELGLFGGHLVGIDGSFFRADASAASIKTRKQIEAELARIEGDIERYSQELAANDAAEGEDAGPGRLAPEQLAALQARAEHTREEIAGLEASGETQVSTTDPDARRLKKNGQKVTGYNVQTVVDDEHKLILTHEVTHAGNDFGQLARMATAAKEALGVETLTVLADAGYFTEVDIAACQARAITPYVPVPDKHRPVSAEGRLPGSTFDYDPEQDIYRCPAGEPLPPVGKPMVRNAVRLQRYRSNPRICAQCPLRTQCIPQKTPVRQIYRSEHADSTERHRARMAAEGGQKMRQRAALCEHPFGTMKRWLGWDHFLVRGFEKVRGEMALLVHCYNFRRVLSILGIERFMAACRARRGACPAGGGGGGLFGLFNALCRRLCTAHARAPRPTRSEATARPWAHTTPVLTASAR